MNKFIRLLTGKPSEEQKDASAFYNELATDVLARTLWGEGRGEGGAGMESIASVILNRVTKAQERGKYWWGNDIISVCQKPYQFSCWNRSDPNYKKLQAVTDQDIHFATAIRIARWLAHWPIQRAAPRITTPVPSHPLGPRAKNHPPSSATTYFTH